MFLLPLPHSPGLVASYLFLCKDCLWTVHTSFQLINVKLFSSIEIQPQAMNLCKLERSETLGTNFTQLFLQNSVLQIHRIQISLLIWNLAFLAWTGVTGSDSQTIFTAHPAREDYVSLLSISYMYKDIYCAGKANR